MKNGRTEGKEGTRDRARTGPELVVRGTRTSYAAEIGLKCYTGLGAYWFSDTGLLAAPPEEACGSASDGTKRAVHVLQDTGWAVSIQE